MNNCFACFGCPIFTKNCMDWFFSFQTGLLAIKGLDHNTRTSPRNMSVAICAHFEYVPGGYLAYNRLKWNSICFAAEFSLRYYPLLSMSVAICAHFEYVPGGYLAYNRLKWNSICFAAEFSLRYYPLLFPKSFSSFLVTSVVRNQSVSQ